MLTNREQPSMSVDASSSAGTDGADVGSGPREVVRIKLLGEFLVQIGARRIEDPWPNRRAAELVKRLALSSSHRLHRDQVIEAMWPCLSAEAGAANLHKAASYARLILDSKRAVVLRAGMVELWPEATIATDVSTLEAAGHRALASNHRDECARLAETFEAELLPSDLYVEWTAGPRERLRVLRLGLLRAAELWEEVLRFDPSDEDAHLALMKSFLADGRRYAAVRQYQRMADSLTEMSLEPGPESLALLRTAANAPRSQEQQPRGPIKRPPPSLLFGREAELARASAAMASEGEDMCGPILVSGEAGIGKSRFCRELMAQARASGGVVIWGSARREEGREPYAPLIEAIGRLLAERRDLIDCMSETGRTSLARLLAPRPADDGDEPQIRGSHAIFTAIIELLDLAAAPAGATLWIDDLHDADEATARLVHHLARLSQGSHFVVLLAYRREALSPSIVGIRSSLMARHAAVEIELLPLGRPASEALIEAVAIRRLAPASVDHVLRLAAGNPFFTEQLAKSVDRLGLVAIPRRLHEVLLGRVGELDAPTRSALESAAVAGAYFSMDDLAALTGLEQPQLIDVLSSGIEHGIISENDDHYQFRHALLREAMVARLPTHRRCSLHADAARKLMAQGGPPGRIGHHLVESGAAGDAVPWFERAARDAVAIGAIADAQEFLDQALAIAPDSAELLELRADCLLASGSPASLHAYAEAVCAARGHRRRRLRIRQARAAIFFGDVEAARRCLDGLIPCGAKESARVLLVEGYLNWLRGNVPAAATCADEAHAIASERTLRVELRDAATLRALVAHSRAEVAAPRTLGVFDGHGTHQLATTIHDGHLCVAELYLNYGDSAVSLETFARELAQTAERTGAARGQAFALLVLGETELFTGRLADAETHLREALAQYRRVASPGGEALALHRLAELCLLRDTPEQAKELLSEALELAHASAFLGEHLLPRIYGTMIESAVDRGEVAGLLTEAEAMVGRHHDHCRTCVLALVIPAAAACSRIGELDRAREYLGRAKNMAEYLSGGGAWSAAILAAEAGLAQAENRPTSERLYLRAAETYDRNNWPIHARRCRRLAADLHTARDGNTAQGQVSGR